LFLLEKEHGDLLIQMKQIQLSIEHFRTYILQITQTINQTKFNIQTQQQINNQIHDQTSKRIHHLIHNTNDIQTLLYHYKSLTDESHYLVKLIFHIQTQIEIHHKSILIYQTKLDKYKQDLTLITINRTDYEHQISNLQKLIHQQNQTSKQLQTQQMQIIQNRQQLHQHIHLLETENKQILNNQQQLIDTIKQTNTKNKLSAKEIFHSNQLMKDLQYSYRQLIKDQNKQQEMTKNLHQTS
jgi:chromosome segregation ATPase